MTKTYRKRFVTDIEWWVELNNLCWQQKVEMSFYVRDYWLFWNYEIELNGDQENVEFVAKVLKLQEVK